MNKLKIIFVLGVWVAILPYLGFPHFLKNMMFSVTGLGFIYLSYISYKNSKADEKEEKTFDNFSENSHFIESEIKPKERADLDSARGVSDSDTGEKEEISKLNNHT